MDTDAVTGEDASKIITNRASTLTQSEPVATNLLISLSYAYNITKLLYGQNTNWQLAFPVLPNAYTFIIIIFYQWIYLTTPGNNSRIIIACPQGALREQ